MLTYLLLTSAAWAGACHCGVDFYLARANGDATAVSPYPDDCLPDEGKDGVLDCISLGAWNPYAHGDAMELQRTRVSTLLQVVDDHPDQAASGAWALVSAATWRMDDEDELFDRTARLANAHYPDEWKTGARVDPEALRDLILAKSCSAAHELNDVIGMREPFLGDMAPSSAWLNLGSVETLRSQLDCDGKRPWRMWGWRALDGPLDADTLWIFDAQDLVFLRNAVFARHGRTFKTPEVKAMFQGLGHWYSPDEAYTDERLTEIDKANVALIQAYEGVVKDGGTHGDAVKAAAPKPTPVPRPTPAKPMPVPQKGGCSHATLVPSVWLVLAGLAGLARRR